MNKVFFKFGRFWVKGKKIEGDCNRFGGYISLELWHQKKFCYFVIHFRRGRYYLGFVYE